MNVITSIVWGAPSASYFFAFFLLLFSRINYQRSLVLSFLVYFSFYCLRLGTRGLDRACVGVRAWVRVCECMSVV